MSRFNQPICERCWIGRNTSAEGIRRPVTIVDAQAEQCAYCGLLTIVGIFVREHPDKVPYPRQEDPDE